MRGTVSGKKGDSEEEVLQKAKELVSVKNQIEGKTIRKIIFIADKLMNIIAN